MASKECKACTDLQTNAPDFAVNGVTSAVCTSLKNNTGLNAKNKNNNCADMNGANDCLIGSLADDIERYDVCDWKTYMCKFVPNVHAIFKALICWLCGLEDRLKALIDRVAKLEERVADLANKLNDLTKRVKDLEDASGNFCDMINDMMTPPALAYGILPSATSAGAKERRCGHIATKNGAPQATPIYPVPDIYVNSQNVGMKYGRKEVTNCKTGKCELREWIAPNFFWYNFGPNVMPGDIIWYISKADAKREFGISDHLWQSFTESSWTWTDYTLWGTNQNVLFKLDIDDSLMGPNYMCLVFVGMSYPNGSPGQTSVNQPTNPEKLYRSACV